MVNGDFGDEVEDYLSDQFWQRDSWTAARSKMKMLLRNKDIGGVAAPARKSERQKR